MARSKSHHSTEQHKRAFELFYDLRTINAVSAELDIDTHTLRRWKTGEINCPCPYHNWDALVQERELALSKRIDLLDQGIVDPLSHEQALLDLDPSRTPPMTEMQKSAVRPAGKVMDRSDLERLSHLEFIYAKLFFHITGCIIDHGALVDLTGEPFDLARCEKYFSEKGLEPRNLEQCVKTLIVVTQQISELREEMGLRKARSKTPPVAVPAAPPVPAPSPAQIEEQVAARPLLEDLRAMKDRFDKMSPEEVRAISEQFNQQDDQKMTLVP